MDDEVLSWRRYIAPDGRPYYYNRDTRKSTWKVPLEFQLDAATISASFWKEYRAPDGRPYYYNFQTKASTWDKPEALQPAQDPTGNAVNSGTDTDNKQPSPEERFWEMLDQAGITADATWEDALRRIITHPDYYSIGTIAERKQAFLRYQKNKRRPQDHGIVQDKLIAVLAKNSLPYWLDFESALEFFRSAQDDEFERLWAVYGTETLRCIYKDAAIALQEREEGRDLSERKRKLAEFRGFLKESVVDPWIFARIKAIESGLPALDFDTRDAVQGFSVGAVPLWGDVVDLCEKESTACGIYLVDCLAVFEDLVKEIELGLEDEVSRSKALFRAFVEGADRLHSDYAWKQDFCSLLRERPGPYWDLVRATLVCGHGPLPWEIFKDVIHEVEERYHRERPAILEWLLQLPDPDVMDSLLEKQRPSNISRSSLITFYLREGTQQPEKKLKEIFKGLRRTRYLGVDSKWADILPRVQDTAEYSDIGEARALEVFDRFMAKVREKDGAATDE